MEVDSITQSGRISDKGIATPWLCSHCYGIVKLLKLSAGLALAAFIVCDSMVVNTKKQHYKAHYYFNKPNLYTVMLRVCQYLIHQKINSSNGEDTGYNCQLYKIFRQQQHQGLGGAPKTFRILISFTCF